MRVESGRRKQGTLPHDTRVEQMLKEQKEYSATLREENRQQTPRQGQVSETDDV